MRKSSIGRVACSLADVQMPTLGFYEYFKQRASRATPERNDRELAHEQPTGAY